MIPYNPCVSELDLQSLGLVFVLLIISVGLIGIGVILLLFRTWARYNRRQHAEPSRRSGPSSQDDIWVTSGQRLGKGSNESDESDESGDSNDSDPDDSDNPDESDDPDDPGPRWAR